MDAERRDVVALVERAALMSDRRDDGAEAPARLAPFEPPRRRR
jgi:hypothetical protein